MPVRDLEESMSDVAFETIAVLSAEMTISEKHAGMTRALNESWIIRN